MVEGPKRVQPNQFSNQSCHLPIFFSHLCWVVQPGRTASDLSPTGRGRSYLEPLDVLHLGGLAGGDAGVEEGGRHRDTEGLGRHAGLRVQ